jgi:hypothetical protein
VISISLIRLCLTKHSGIVSLEFYLVGGRDRTKLTLTQNVIGTVYPS